MNKAIFAAGGIILIAGGIYWYLSQQNGNGVRCSDYTTQSDCEANSCYWCNGQCQSSPCGSEHCNPLYLGECHSGIEGWQKCDPLSNALCKCQNGKWICIEQSSPTCINNISHKECGVNLLGEVICGSYAGAGVDQCGSLGQGCSCATGTCHAATHCCSDQICRRKAQDTIVVDDTNWACIQIPRGNQCDYILPEPLASTSIINGEFFWKWGIILVQIKCSIEGYYNGSWTELWNSGWVWMGGTTGHESVNVVFEGARCIEALRFKAINDYGANTKPASFVGTFSW